MTAVPSQRQDASRQRGLKSLVGVMSFVCLVLFLLAIEQKQAVAAWQAVRTQTVPAAGRWVDWVRDGASHGLTGLRRTAEASARTTVAADPADRILAGDFAPADEAARDAVGAVTFAGARLQFESGETLETRPLRIAAGREVFVQDGPSFAERLDAPEDAQIELRRVVPASDGRTVAASPLCGGQAPGAVALLHRRDRVDVLVFRHRTIIGPDAAPSSLCGVWSFRQR